MCCAAAWPQALALAERHGLCPDRLAALAIRAAAWAEGLGLLQRMAAQQLESEQSASCDGDRGLSGLCLFIYCTNIYIYVPVSLSEGGGPRHMVGNPI